MVDEKQQEIYIENLPEGCKYTLLQKIPVILTEEPRGIFTAKAKDIGMLIEAVDVSPELACDTLTDYIIGEMDSLQKDRKNLGGQANLCLEQLEKYFS